MVPPVQWRKKRGDKAQMNSLYKINPSETKKKFYKYMFILLLRFLLIDFLPNQCLDSS